MGSTTSQSACYKFSVKVNGYIIMLTLRRPGEMPPDYDASAEEPEKKERPRAAIPDYEDPTIQPECVPSRYSVM